MTTGPVANQVTNNDGHLLPVCYVSALLVLLGKWVANMWPSL